MVFMVHLFILFVLFVEYGLFNTRTHTHTHTLAPINLQTITQLLEHTHTYHLQVFIFLGASWNENYIFFKLGSLFELLGMGDESLPRVIDVTRWVNSIALGDSIEIPFVSEVIHHHFFHKNVNALKTSRPKKWI